MSWEQNFLPMLPEHLLLLGIVKMLGVEVWSRWRGLALPLSIGFVLAAVGASVWMYMNGMSGVPFTGQFSITPNTQLAKAIVLSLAVPVLLMSRDDFKGGELPALILSSLYGVCLLISADSFLTMFLGLELMSLPVYALILLAYRRPESAEAALKYLVLGGTATAMFLMGVSLLYGVSGHTGISTFADALIATDLMSRAAVVLILLAFFLKAAVVPFHAWAPDAYEGASVTVTAYMATIVKAGVLLAIVRLFANVKVLSPMVDLLAIFPLVSIVWGNLAAMKQPSFRRMIAYSSIAHAGYLFYALLGDGDGRMQAVTFYLLSYGVLNLLAFAALPKSDDDYQRDRLENLKGLYQRNPFAAIVIGIAMLSLAGIPPFPGFVAKFLIFKNVLAAGYTTYAVIGLVGSYVGVYFYLRVIQFMFMTAPAESAEAMVPHHGDGTGMHGNAVDGLNAHLTPSFAHAEIAESSAGFNVPPSVTTVHATLGAFAQTAILMCLAATLVISVFPGWFIGRL